jgi:hypothetical protein
MTPPPITTQTLTAYPAAAFRVTEGVAEGDALSFADELVMDDIYQLAPGARRGRLTLLSGGAPGRFAIAADSELGQAGRLLVLDCCLTLMPRDGTTVEALVLVEVEDGSVAEVYLMPLATLAPRTDYRLVGIDRDGATRRLAEVACVSFTRGTHITLASGEQRRIEDLRVGDRVLTRDDGPQPVRWIGRTTLRAVGEFAPVVIRKGVLHNENDLVVSPDHRLFVYQRQDRLGTGRPEVLVKVRHLINGDSVFQRDGGFVEYFQLLFDSHQIIYAEGIAAESLLIDPLTRAALPRDAPAPRHAYRRHQAYEVPADKLGGPDAAERLRRASGAD